jgi:hypothetical protein
MQARMANPALSAHGAFDAPQAIRRAALPGGPPHTLAEERRAR